MSSRRVASPGPIADTTSAAIRAPTVCIAPMNASLSFSRCSGSAGRAAGVPRPTTSVSSDQRRHSATECRSIGTTERADSHDSSSAASPVQRYLPSRFSIRPMAATASSSVVTPRTSAPSALASSAAVADRFASGVKTSSSTAVSTMRDSMKALPRPRIASGVVSAISSHLRHRDVPPARMIRQTSATTEDAPHSAVLSHL
jgi:hypothetical protein